jgi:GT2 family glycosyltransferase
LVNQQRFPFLQWRFILISQNDAAKKPTLSVVIVTYNRCSDLEDLLDSLFSMSEIPNEILVVDSNSTDGTKSLVKKYPIKYISINEKSRIKARNIGFQNAKGDILSFLDDDVIMSKGWTKAILEPYKSMEVGGVGGRVLPLDETEQVSNIPEKYRAIGKVFDNGFVSNNYDVSTKLPIEVDTLIGCNMSFRRKCLFEIGGFDDNFLGNCYREETDVSVRVKKLNCKLMYQPRALVWHKYKGKKIDRKWFYWYSYNHFYFCFKNLQPVRTTKFVRLLFGAFLPPSGYLKKSGITFKPDPLAALEIISGIIAADKVYRNRCRQVKTSS